MISIQKLELIKDNFNEPGFTLKLSKNLEVHYLGKTYFVIYRDGNIDPSSFNCVIHKTLTRNQKEKVYTGIIKKIREIKTVEVSTVFTKIRHIEFVSHRITRYSNDYSSKDTDFISELFDLSKLTDLDDGTKPSVPDSAIGYEFLIEHTRINACSQNSNYFKYLNDIHKMFYDDSITITNYHLTQSLASHIDNIKKAITAKNNRYANYKDALGYQYSRSKLVLLLEDTTTYFICKVSGETPNLIILKEILEHWKQCPNISYIANYHEGKVWLHSIEDIDKLIGYNMTIEESDLEYGQQMITSQMCP